MNAPNRRTRADRLRKAVRDPQEVYGVGCNVGEWSQTAIRNFPTAHIHCFERSESPFRTLSTNLTGSNFVLNSMGMGNKDAAVEYKDYGDNSMGNTLLVDATYRDRRIDFQMKRSAIRADDAELAAMLAG